MSARVGGAYRGLVDLHAQAGRLPAADGAFGERERRAVDDVVEQFRVGVVVDADALFLDQEVGSREGDLQAGGERERPEWTVRGEQRVEGLREGGNPAHLGDTARVREIRLRHGDPGLQRGQEFGARV